MIPIPYMVPDTTLLEEYIAGFLWDLGELLLIYGGYKLLRLYTYPHDHWLPKEVWKQFPFQLRFILHWMHWTKGCTRTNEALYQAMRDRGWLEALEKEIANRE